MWMRALGGAHEDEPRRHANDAMHLGRPPAGTIMPTHTSRAGCLWITSYQATCFQGHPGTIGEHKLPQDGNTTPATTKGRHDDRHHSNNGLSGGSRWRFCPAEAEQSGACANLKWRAATRSKADQSRGLALPTSRSTDGCASEIDLRRSRSSRCHPWGATTATLPPHRRAPSHDCTHTRAPLVLSGT